MNLAETVNVTFDDIQYELARRDFHEFLKYVKIKDVRPGEQSSGTIPFEYWPHLKELNDHILSTRLVQVLKGRQTGASWDLVAYALWMAMYNRGVQCGATSKTELESYELISKAKFIYNHLPKPMQVPVKSLDNKAEMVFSANDSWLRVFAPTKDVGRSYTFTMFLMDEFDFQPYQVDTIEGVKPTLDDIGGQMLIASTSNPDTIDSTFKTIWRSENNGYEKLFVSALSRPDRNDEWYDRGLSETTNRFRFKRENPLTAEEALSPPDSLTAFDYEILEWMRSFCREPIERIGPINVYTEFNPGARYVAATDTAKGGGMDYSVTTILDVTENEKVVADIFTNTLNVTQFVHQSILMLMMYESPVWAIETNGIGEATMQAAQNEGYKNLYFRTEKAAGWFTSGGSSGGTYGGTRAKVWENLIDAVHRKQVIIPNVAGLKQFYDVVRDPARNSRVEAITGGHDDYPITIGIALQIKQHARKTRGEAKVDASGENERRRWQDRIMGRGSGAAKW